MSVGFNVAETKALPRAWRYPVMVKDLLKDMSLPIATSIHSALGISGEVGEMIGAIILEDEPNFIEEAGDTHFYATGLLNQYNFDRETIAAVDPEESDRLLCEWFMDSPEDGMVYYSAQIIDVLKKTWAYDKTLVLDHLEYALGMFYKYFEFTINVYDLTFDDIEAHNQYKLVTGPNARYKTGKYSNEQAIARADKEA